MNGKTLFQLQAEQMAQRLFTDLMASAGVSHGRMSQEVLFFLPRDFIDRYSDMFHRAFGGKDDGGVNARGQSQAESGVLQKGKTAAKTNGKKYKKHWVVADEDVLRLKERIDKRLRAMARDIVEELEAIEERRARGEEGDRGGGGGGQAARRTVQLRTSCEGCGHFLGDGWKFCSSCGTARAT